MKFEKLRNVSAAPGDLQTPDDSGTPGDSDTPRDLQTPEDSGILGDSETLGHSEIPGDSQNWTQLTFGRNFECFVKPFLFVAGIVRMLEAIYCSFG